MGSPCAAAGTRFVDRSGKSNPSEEKTAYVDLRTRKTEENLSLLPQTVSLPVQKAEPALPTVPATAPEPVEQLPQKNPASRQSGTPPGIAGCWLRPFCWGVRQPVYCRPYAMPGRQSCCGIIWKRGKGCLHRAVCKGRYSFLAWNIWLSALWSACFWYWGCLPLGL